MAISKPSPSEIRGLTRSVESATGGSAGKGGSESENVDSDELIFDSDLSEDNASWRKITKNFAIKPSNANLSKMELLKLQDQADFPN